MITRNDIFNWFCDEQDYLTDKDLKIVFATLSDKDLAHTYNLNIIRKGYFTRK